MNLRVGSLFTGYGGLDIAVGGDLAWYAEIEPAACQVLAHHYPNVPNLGDITKINWDDVEPVDVITGGYPCQPFSHAGNRKGKNDERHLWPNVLDAICAIRPRFAILENVSGHLTLGFADVLADLAKVGMSAQWGTFRASDVGAPHRRERIFIIAYTDGEGSQRRVTRPEDAIRPGSRGAASDDCGIIPANTNNSGWLENVEQSSDIAATPGQGQPSVIDRSGADRDVATGSGALVAANSSGERHGSGERPASVERVGGASKGSGWETSAARQEFGTGSVDDAANTDNKRAGIHGGIGGQGRQPGGTPGSTVLRSSDGQVGANGLGAVCSVDTGSVGILADSKGNKQRESAKLGKIRAELGDGFDAGSVRLERNCGSVAAHTDWGKYAPAIRRWEAVLDRAAPAPTTPGRNDRPRLNPQFVEWMMGLPDGWVTGHGLSAAKELKMLGNGVVPQQAHAAITQLLERTQQ